jgi:predicted transcriptional regulator
MLTVKDCMITDIVTIGRSCSLQEMISLFKKYRFHTLPVVENGIILGKVTLDSIISVFTPQSAEINRILMTVPFLEYTPDIDVDLEGVTPEMGFLVVADDIMERGVSQIGPDESLQAAYSMMKLHKTKVLVVSDRKRNMLGMLGLFDIIYKLFTIKGIV